MPPETETHAQDVEARTQALGRELLAAIGAADPAWWQPSRWTQEILAFSTQHEAEKLRLFRFIDVLPALTTDRAVIAHLQAYFQDDTGPFAGLVRRGLRIADLGPLGRRAAVAALRRVLAQIAHTFIAGELDEADQAAARLWRDGQAITVDVVGEATLSEREADQYLDRYLQLIERLSQAAYDWPDHPALDLAPWGVVPRVNLSVKLTALAPHLDPAAPDDAWRRLAPRLERLIAAARARGAHIQVDVEAYRLKDLTLTVFERLVTGDALRDYAHVGLVLQAYLREAECDAERLIQLAEKRGAPLTIRLVKGAYWDHETALSGLTGWPIPVFEEKAATDLSFERIAAKLLPHPQIRLAVGSHNVRSVAHALALAERAGLAQGSLEFQFLYGMAAPLRQALVERGERVRVYAPLGELIPGMAYLVRRLLENTANESFVLQQQKTHDPGLLLAPPEPSGEAAPRPAGEAGRSAVTLRDPSDFANSPPADFAQAQAREAMAAALRTVPHQFGRTWPLVIAGKEIATARTIASTNPAVPEQVIGHVASAGSDDVERAVQAARAAQPDWAALEPEARANRLRRAAELMEERRCELASWAVYEAGKPWREADGDVCEAIDFLRYYAQLAPPLLAPLELGRRLGEVNHYRREARGVAAIIAPWNFPLAIPTGMTAAALVTGNAAILKPAEQTPVIAYQLCRILWEAGVPPGVLHYLPGTGEAGAALVEHPGVHLIAFTGSKAVGLAILHKAARPAANQRHLKRVIAETGGKNAIIVDEDADLDEAVEGVLSSAFGYSGQKCSAGSRVIVVGSAYRRFCDRLFDGIRSLPQGPAADPATILCPLITAEAAERVRGAIAAAQHEAEFSLVVPPTGPGHSVGAAAFVGLPPGHSAWQEEIFGPVLAITQAANFAEALERAADSEYALTGGLYSRHPEHIRTAAANWRVGNLYVNRKTTGALVGRQPFGGLRLSGAGYPAGGPDYLLQFVEARTVSESTLRRGFASQSLEFEE